jgi:hypothetical protein
MSTQRKSNRFLNASPSQQCPAHGSHREALEAYGLIWRTLATYSEALGRTQCRSSLPTRRHL